MTDSQLEILLSEVLLSLQNIAEAQNRQADVMEEILRVARAEKGEEAYPDIWGPEDD